MPQIYFLSVLLNALTGYILAFGGEETGGEGFSLSLNNETFRLILGWLSLAAGILKLLSPMPGNVPVVGDLVPALANLGGGGILLFELYRGRGGLDSAAAEKIEEYVEKYGKLAGFVCLAAAALHFIFYPVLFL